MKTLIKIIIGFGLILNINAQSIEKTSFKISINNKTQSTFKFNQKIKVLNGINLVATSQLGNLMMTRIEAKKAKINLKDFYNDFDFGLNLGFYYSLKKHLNLKALYNIGILKFDSSDSTKSKGYVVQLTVDYAF